MDTWTVEQLAAAVEAYRYMQAEVDAGRPLNKAKVYRELAERYGRRPGAWEYRMQNISHVLAGLNQPWIEGLRPASNVGPTATQQLIQLLKNAGSEPSALDDSIERLLAEASHSAEVSGTFSPATTADQRRRVLTSIVRRRGQPQFRANLLSAYEGRCAISNCNVVSVLEAAHVHPYTGDASNDVSNGLLLRADIHTLFDLYLVSVDPNSLTVVGAPVLKGTMYESFVGVSVATPSRKEHRLSEASAAWHRSQCNW